MRSFRVVARTVLGIAIVATGASAAFLPAQANGADVPGAPTQVVASNATATSLAVSWAAPVNDGGAAIIDYSLEYRKVGEVSWDGVTRPTSTATSITVRRLEPGSVYQFRVAAINSAGTGPWSVQAPIIGVGRDHACVLVADGTVRCWGDNEVGILGDGTSSDRLVPVQVSGITGANAATTSISVSSGAAYSCAVMANGSLTCWGGNNFGELGDGTTTHRLVPVQVSGITGADVATTALSVSPGGGHTCAVMASGAVRCWGRNPLGELGDGSNMNSRVPVQVSGITGTETATSAINVSAGEYYSCAVMANGTIRCWGSNYLGALGDGTTTNSRVPVQVSGITGADAATTAISVSTGGANSCALMANGTVKCWGANNVGMLGNGTTTDSLVPVLVSGITGVDAASTAISVSTRGGHSCAVMANGTVSCWGSNDDGVLGDGTTTDSNVPVQVSGITGVDDTTTALSVSTRSGGQSCAVLADGSVTCWGPGALAIGTNVDSYVPVPVPRITGALSDFGRTLLAQLTRPQQLVVTGRDADSIAIRWSEPADNGGRHINYYRVNYRPASSHSWTSFAIVPYSQLGLRVNGLRAGVTYEFQVRANNATGLGDSSRIVTETVPIQASAPVVVDKLWDNRAITTTWRAVRTPAHSPITGYVMSCQDRDGETFRKEVGPAALSASLRVPAAQLYSCRVAAVTDAGRGEGSERVQISTRIRD